MFTCSIVTIVGTRHILLLFFFFCLFFVREQVLDVYMPGHNNLNT